MAADTTVKIFSSAQAGAPSLANVAGNLIAVLDACLVDGFGLKTCDSVVIAGGVGTASISTGHSAIIDGVVLFAGATGTLAALNGERKVTSISTNNIVFDASDLADGTVTGTITVKMAPAGWAKAFAGTNLAAYKSANVAASGALLRVDDTIGAYAGVRGYEAMTDVSTGTGQFPTVAQQATNVWYKSNAATARPWWIISNGRMLYLGIASNRSYAATVAVYAFGDIVSRKAGDAYRAILMAVNNTSAPSSYSDNPVCAASDSYHNKYAARSYAGLGSAIAITQTWMDSNANTTYCSGYGGRAYPNPEDNSIVFAPILIVEGATYRGGLPGLYATPQYIGNGIADDTRLSGIPGYDRKLIYKVYQSSSAPNYGGVFFDLTGPWGS